jgi:hypothetical protein
MSGSKGFLSHDSLRGEGEAMGVSSDVHLVQDVVIAVVLSETAVPERERDWLGEDCAVICHETEWSRGNWESEESGPKDQINDVRCTSSRWRCVRPLSLFCSTGGKGGKTEYQLSSSWYCQDNIPTVQ